MEEDKFLVPQHGLLVRDPISKDIISENGEWKPYYGSAAGRYWRRRVKDGSVKIGTPKKAELQKGDENKFKRKREDVENGD
jgi:hypothetical protein